MYRHLRTASIAAGASMGSPLTSFRSLDRSLHRHHCVDHHVAFHVHAPGFRGINRLHLVHQNASAHALRDRNAQFGQRGRSGQRLPEIAGVRAGRNLGNLIAFGTESDAVPVFAPPVDPLAARRPPSNDFASASRAAAVSCGGPGRSFRCSRRRRRRRPKVAASLLRAVPCLTLLSRSERWQDGRRPWTRYSIGTTPSSHTPTIATARRATAAKAA